MKTIQVTPMQRRVLQALDRKDLATLRRYPGLVREGRHLVKAFKRVIRHVEKLHDHSNARKRRTAYARIVDVCERALARIEQ